MLSFIMGIHAFAETYPPIDLEQKCNLTLAYEGNGTEFRLYRIASVTSNAKFDLLPAYSSYSPSTIRSLENTESEWADLAEKLSRRFSDDHINADYTLKIQNGKASVTNIPLGLYLMTGSSVKVDNITYHPIPTFVMVPEWSQRAWQYAFTAEPKKWTETDPSPAPVSSNYSVTKVWKNDNTNTRPKEITVVIRKNNGASKTVVLNAANNWQYTWVDADQSVVYSVSEQSVSASYSLVISGTSHDFILTNIYQGTPPPHTSDFTQLDRNLMIFCLSLCIALAAGISLKRAINHD